MVTAHPSVTKFQVNLGRSYSKTAYLLYGAGQTDQAVALTRKSIEILERLVQSHPDNAGFHGALGLSWNSLGYFLDEKMRKNDEAIPAFQTAIAEQRIAARIAPADTEYKLYLVNHLENLGEQYVDLNRVAEGLPHYQAALEIRRRIAAAQLENRDYVRDLAKALAVVGNIQRHVGDATGGRQSFAEAQTWLQPIAAGSPDRQAQLASIRAQIGLTYADTGQVQQAASVPRASDRRAPGCHGTTDRPRRAARLALRGALGAGADPAATRSAQRGRRRRCRAARLWTGRPTREIVDLALEETKGAGVIGYGKCELPPPAAQVRDLDLDLACGHLQMAIQRGFTDVRTIRSHPDGELLMARAEVRAWIDGTTPGDEPAGPRP